MPMKRDLYPKNWEAIATNIKTKANWTCEKCGQQCQRPGERPEDFMDRISTGRLSECPVVADYLQHPRKYLLTVAHLDHIPQNNHPDNLKAWCTRCHCRYDLAQMPKKKQLKLERRGQLRIDGV